MAALKSSSSASNECEIERVSDVWLPQQIQIRIPDAGGLNLPGKPQSCTWI
jgi:hypothetical protein